MAFTLLAREPANPELPVVFQSNNSTYDFIIGVMADVALAHMAEDEFLIENEDGSVETYGEPGWAFNEGQFLPAERVQPLAQALCSALVDGRVHGMVQQKVETYRDSDGHSLSAAEIGQEYALLMLYCSEFVVFLNNCGGFRVE